MCLCCRLKSLHVVMAAESNMLKKQTALILFMLRADVHLIMLVVNVSNVTSSRKLRRARSGALIGTDLPGAPNCGLGHFLITWLQAGIKLAKNCGVALLLLG